MSRLHVLLLQRLHVPHHLHILEHVAQNETDRVHALLRQHDRDAEQRQERVAGVLTRRQRGRQSRSLDVRPSPENDAQRDENRALSLVAQQCRQETDAVPHRLVALRRQREEQQ